MSLATVVQTFVVGAVFGLALAAPPGPMNAVIAEESVLRGWLAGFTAGLGAMSADFIFFVLSLIGVVAVLRDATTVKGVMVGVGGFIMLYYAYGAVNEVQNTFSVDAETVPPGTDGIDSPENAGRRGFQKAFVLALTNPYQIVFWLTVGVGLLEPGRIDILSRLPAIGTELAGVLVVQTGSPALLVGLFGGIVLWIVGFPATLVSVGRRIDAFAPIVAVLSALVLVGFGVTFLWDAVQTLFV